jgi:hypothetical protein
VILTAIVNHWLHGGGHGRRRDRERRRGSCDQATASWGYRRGRSICGSDCPTGVSVLAGRPRGSAQRWIRAKPPIYMGPGRSSRLVGHDVGEHWAQLGSGRWLATGGVDRSRGPP